MGYIHHSASFLCVCVEYFQISKIGLLEYFADVSRGMWYFEVNVEEMREGSACRIGWGQAFANLQTPLGFDKFGYCWRSRYCKLISS